MHVDVRQRALNEPLCMSPGRWVMTSTLGLYYSIMGRMVIAPTSVIGYQHYACHISRVGLTTVPQCLWVLAGNILVCCAGCAASVVLISKGRFCYPGASCAAVLLRQLPAPNYFAVILLSCWDVRTHKAATDSPSCNSDVHWSWICCVSSSPPANSTKRAGDFWLKSRLLKLEN